MGGQTMGYVDQNLMSGETILHRGNLHWAMFLTGFILLLLGLLLFFSSDLIFFQGLGVILLIISTLRLLNELIAKLTSEFVITSRRVIVKYGLIRRVTSELNHNNVESLNVHQGILGRMLDYGTIVVNGTGGHRTPVPSISSPLQFRTKAMEIIDSSQE